MHGGGSDPQDVSCLLIGALSNSTLQAEDTGWIGSTFTHFVIKFLNLFARERHLNGHTIHILLSHQVYCALSLCGPLPWGQVSSSHSSVVATG
jgi:hypothetical protein